MPSKDSFKRLVAELRAMPPETMVRVVRGFPASMRRGMVEALSKPLIGETPDDLHPPLLTPEQRDTLLAELPEGTEASTSRCPMCRVKASEPVVPSNLLVFSYASGYADGLYDGVHKKRVIFCPEHEALVAIVLARRGLA